MLGFMLLSLLLTVAFWQSSATTSTPTTLPVTVISRGDSKPPLSVKDLQIKEDGKPVDGAELRKRDENDPFLWIILLDASNSQRAEFEEKRNAAIRVTEYLVRPQDKVVALVFKDADHLAVNGKEGSKTAAIELFNSSKAEGTTATFEALIAVTDFSRRFGMPIGSSALLHFGDGDDNASMTNIQDAIAKLQAADISVFPILLTGAKNSARGTKNLEKIARETGGAMLNDAGKESLETWEGAIRQRLLVSYQVSPPRDGSKPKMKKHSVEVGTPSSGELLYRKKRIEYSAQ